VHKQSHSPGQQEASHAFRAREHCVAGLRRRLLDGRSEQAFHLRQGRHAQLRAVPDEDTLFKY